MPRIGDPAAPVAGIGTVRRIVYNALNSAYPARPSGLAAGLVEWVGPVEPSDWLDGDTWIDIS